MTVEKLNYAVYSVANVLRLTISGGNLHLVICDGNTEREYLQWCINVGIERNLCESWPELLDAEAKCAESLLELPKKMRDKAIKAAKTMVYGG